MLSVLPPIPTEKLTAADVDDLVKTTRERMLEELIKLTELARGQGIAMSASQAQHVEGSGALKASGMHQPRET